VQPKAASSDASALLSALDIWSTSSAAPEAAKTSETRTHESKSHESKSPESKTHQSKTPVINGDAQAAPAAPIRSAAAPAQPAAADQAAHGDITPRRPGEKRDEKRFLASPANPTSAQPRAWPPRKLSLALQGGGGFGAFTWGVLDRLLEEGGVEFGAISGASVGAVNAALLACGLIVDGREGARKLLARFWNRVTKETSFRSLMLVGGFSPAGSSVAFGQTLQSGRFDPFDLDPLRRALQKDIDFDALRASICPKLLVAATRIRDGGQKIFRNAEITADTLLASTCPPMAHCAVEIDGESYWDGGYSGNPPVVGLVQESDATDVLVVQVTPARDHYVPITSAAIDRRLDQITANAALNTEIAGLEWASRDDEASAQRLRIFRLAAEDEIEGLAQRSAVDLGRSFITQLHCAGYTAADRWLRQTPNQVPSSTDASRREPTAFWLPPSFADTTA
jgi:NTE family protein